MAESGLLGVGIPEEYGGIGGGVGQMAAVMETMSQAGAPPVFLVLTGICRTVILRHGTESQKQRYIPPTVTGKAKLCFALTEPDAGSNSFRIRSRAERTARGTYRVNGEKVFITGVDEADHMLIAVRTTPYDDVSNRRDGLSLLLVDTRSPGIEWVPLDMSIVVPERQFIVFLNDVEVPAENLLGEEGNGGRYLFDALNPERMIVAALSIGLGDYALAKAVAYAKERAPFDAPIGSYQSLQHPMAYAKAHLEAARLMLHHACRIYDQGGEAGPAANMAKLLATEAGVEACNIAIQVHGGNGFSADYDIVSLWPVARLQEVIPISNQMVLNYIGEHVLGLPKSY